MIPLSARLVYNNTVLLEKAVGPEGEVLFDKVDFNQPPERYYLTLELSPGTESALAADVSQQESAACCLCGVQQPMVVVHAWTVPHYDNINRSLSARFSELHWA
jgi:hypothetical protein